MMMFIVRDRINSYVWFRDRSGEFFTKETACEFAKWRREHGCKCQVWEMIDDAPA